MSQTPRTLVMPATGAEAVPLPSYLPAGHYAELKRRIMKAGLLEPQPLYYTRKIAGTICLAIPSLILLLLTRNLWLQALNAVYLTAVFAQFSFIGHDVGHRQVIHSGRLCTVLELVFGNLLV